MINGETGNSNVGETSEKKEKPNTLEDFIKEYLPEFISTILISMFGLNGLKEEISENNKKGLLNNFSNIEASMNDLDLKKLIEALPDGPRKKFLLVAISQLGVSNKNLEGQKTIAKYHAEGGGLASCDAKTPWCMSFVQYCLKKSGSPESSLNTALAKDGLKMGRDSTKNPQIGDLVIVDRNGGGHIGIFLGKNKNGYPIIIGGNQNGGKVSVKVEDREIKGIRSVFV